MYKNICFLNIVSNGENNSNKLCNKKNMYKYSNLTNLNYLLCKCNEDECIDNNLYEEIVKSRLLCNSDDYTFNIEDVLSKFILNIKDIDIIVVYNAIDEFNVLINECLRYCQDIDLSNYCIINLNNFITDNSNISLIELYNSKFDNKDISNIYMVKELFFELYKSIDDNNLYNE